MTKRRKIILIIVIAVLLIYAVIWYIGVCHQYVLWKYEFVTKYNTWDVYEDEDYYDYSFRRPFFFQFQVGNLAIGPSIVHDSNMVVDKEGNVEYMPKSSIIICVAPLVA